MRTPQDVDAWFDGVATAGRAIPSGTRAVVIADWRSCPLLSDEASERARMRLTQSNAVVERSAALAHSESAITVLQFLRLCRDSGNANRRLFTESAPLITWLAEVLLEPERRRLVDFLAEYDSRDADVAAPRAATQS